MLDLLSKHLLIVNYLNDPLFKKITFPIYLLLFYLFNFLFIFILYLSSFKKNLLTLFIHLGFYCCYCRAVIHVHTRDWAESIDREKEFLFLKTILWPTALTHWLLTPFFVWLCMTDAPGMNNTTRRVVPVLSLTCNTAHRQYETRLWKIE